MDTADFHKLVEEDFIEKIERVRAMSGEDRVREGVRLFGIECELMRIILRHWNSNATKAEIDEKVRENLRRQKEKEYEGIYFDLELGTSIDEFGVVYPPRVGASAP